MDEQEKVGKDGPGAPKKLQKSYFDVLGLCCSSEIPLIENILKQLDGVKDVSIIVASRTVIVVHDSLLVSQTQIVNALNQARLEANVKMRGDGSHKKKWPSPYAMASGALLLLSFLKYVYHPMGWLALGAVAVGIFPIALRAMAAIRSIRLDINVLALIAVTGTIAMRDYLEAGTIVFLFSIAEWLQSMASHKARAAMSSLMSIAPQKATIAETGEEVDVDEVKLNTVLAVKAGEVIPIDGIVADGKSEVDEKTLTGESFPVSKEKDSYVWAGTINLNGYISVKTTALAEDCVVAKMAKLVEEAQNKKSRTQRFVDKFAQFYTPAIVVVFLCFLVIPMALRVRNRDYWVHLALVILVSGCPCALVLSTPVATFCALTKAAKSGLLIKGGDYLETLAKIKTVAFDKTGTITRGEFVVADFKALSTEISRETLLYWVSSIESKSSHPLATAVVQFGRSSGIVPKPEDVEDFQNFPGEGIYGRIDGRDFFIGNKKIANKAGSQIVPSSEGENEMGGKTVGYIFLGADLVGVLSLSDECRTGVSEAIRELKDRNIQTVMLTGDSQAAAMNAQNQLANTLDQVYAELLPEDKSKIIQQLQNDGRTAMVGDGINDALALATSNIGISMGISGSALATETGHVILMSNDIRKIPKAISLAKRARRKVFENVFLSLFMRAAILALAFAGHPLVWAAVLTDTGSCLLVIMNSMLLLRGGHKHGQAQKCSRKSCGAPKEQQCIGDDISSGQNRKQCCNEKKCGSSVLPQVHTHGHGDSKTTALKNCCESTKCSSKQRSTTTQKVSCETGNCGSVQKCTRVRHSSQSDASSDEIVEIPNPGRKQGCCTGNRTECNPGTANNTNHSSSESAMGCCSENKCSKSPRTNVNNAVSDHKGVADHCCPGSYDSVKASAVTCCTTDGLEKSHQARVSNHSSSEGLPSCCSGNKCSKSPKTNVDQAVSGRRGDVDRCCLGGRDTVKDISMACCASDDLEKNLHARGPNHSSSKSVPSCCSGTKCSKTTKTNVVRAVSDHKGDCCLGSSDTPKETSMTCCALDDLERNLHAQGSTCESIHKGTCDLTECSNLSDESGPVEIPTVAHGCCSLEKREIGGCCKSYMKECCAKNHHGHLGHHGFGGCLTEIIIE